MSAQEPRQGQRLRLTLDLELQRAANDAIQRGVEAASQNGAKAGAFVAMDPRNGEILALGSYPSFDANEFAKPISQKRYDAALLRGARRAAVQPRDRRHLSDRLDVQADHRDGGARGGRDHARRRTIVDNGEYKLGDQVRKNAKDAVFGALQLPRALTVSSDVFFYQLGEQLNAKGAGAAGVGAQARPRPQDRDRHPGRVRRPDPGPRVAQQGLRRVPQVHEEGQGRRGARPRRCTSAAASSARGPRATTSASRSARATSRPRRSSSPRPTRRSSTAARSSARTSASRSRTASGRLRRGDPHADPPPRRTSTPAYRDAIMAGPARRGDRRRTAPRPTCSPTSRLPRPAVRQDRHRRAPAEPRPVLVRLLRRPTR